MHHLVILSEAAPRILRAAESKDLRLLLHLPSFSPNPPPCHPERSCPAHFAGSGVEGPAVAFALAVLLSKPTPCHPERSCPAHFAGSGVEGPAVAFALVLGVAVVPMDALTAPQTSSLAFPTPHSNPPSQDSPAQSTHLLHPRPSLQLFLPSDRILHKRMPLKPHQSIAVVLHRVPLEHPILVLPDSRLNITGHPNIKIMAPASHNVGVIHNLVHRASVNHPHNPNKSFPSLPHSNSTPMPPTPCHPELRGSQHFVSHEVEGPALATAVARPPSPRITGCPSIAVFAMGGM
jgi:hypothetical protein